MTCPKTLVLFVLFFGCGRSCSKLHVSTQILKILLSLRQRYACFYIILIYDEHAQINFKGSKGACVLCLFFYLEP